MCTTVTNIINYKNDYNMTPVIVLLTGSDLFSKVTLKSWHVA